MSGITIEVDGKSDALLDGRLLSMLVEEAENGIAHCELTFQNYLITAEDYLYFGIDKPFGFGKPIVVKAPPGPTCTGTEPVTIFEGKVTGIEGRFPAQGEPEILILAEDALQSLRMTRRTRTFLDKTDAEVMKAIAAEHSLTVSSTISGGDKHKCVVQLNQSDLAFVRELARRVGAAIGISDKKFHIDPRPKWEAGKIKLTYGAELLEFSVLADATAQRTKVIVAGWDPETKKGIKSEASSACISAETSGLKGGDAAAKSVAGEGCAEQIVHPLPIAETEAKALAEAAYAQMARRFVTGTGTSEGAPCLRIGNQIELSGLGSLFSGKYRVTELRHTFAPDLGYRTQFRVERPGTGS